jgi:hypothetical protein
LKKKLDKIIMKGETMQKLLKRLIIVIFSIFIFLPILSYGGDWEKPWSKVKHKSVASCKKIFEDYQLQAVCMENEKEGYNKLQGNFGMPAKEARKAKERCQKVFDNFQLQAVCMENESKGYKQMKKYE